MNFVSRSNSSLYRAIEATQKGPTKTGIISRSNNPPPVHPNCVYDETLQVASTLVMSAVEPAKKFLLSQLLFPVHAIGKLFILSRARIHALSRHREENVERGARG